MKRQAPPGVRVQCGSCGEENLAAHPDLAVVAYEPPGDGGPFLLYTCRGCRGRRVRPLTAGDVGRLEAAGVRVTRVRRPPAREGPPLGLDDLIDLHERLGGA